MPKHDLKGTDHGRENVPELWAAECTCGYRTLLRSNEGTAIGALFHNHINRLQAEEPDFTPEQKGAILEGWQVGIQAEHQRGEHVYPQFGCPLCW